VTLNCVWKKEGDMSQEDADTKRARGFLGKWFDTENLDAIRRLAEESFTRAEYDIFDGFMTEDEERKRLEGMLAAGRIDDFIARLHDLLCIDLDGEPVYRRQKAQPGNDEDQEG